MKFWVDAQLPPTLAAWLSQQYAIEATSLRDLGLRDAADIDIFLAAQRAQVVMISKDSDFVELVSRHGSPPQLLWVTCGNVTNQRLQEVFAKTFHDALSALTSGQAIVEIG
jgi:predicted nuclease of predicted toxin-antitoxin system